MCKKQFLIFSSLCYFQFILVESCTRDAFKTKKVEREEDVIGRQLLHVVLQSRLGKAIETKAYDNKHFLSQKGPVDGGDELSCDFESDCCWANSNSDDKSQNLEWNVVDKSPEEETFQKTFRTKEAPTGRFLIATSAVAKPKVRAEFVSCDLLCTDKEVIVTFKHWSTPKVNLEVCVQSAFSSKSGQENKKNCQEIPSRLSPGPTTMSLSPIGDYFVVKFIASNFVDKGGAIAILDDISVSAAPCSRQPQLIGASKTTESTKSAAPKLEEVAPKSNGTNKNDNACKKLTCDFEGTTCGYVDANGRIGNRALHQLYGRVGANRNSVQAAAKGKTYIGAVLRPHDKVALEADNVSISDDGVLRFRFFQTADDVTLKICLNSTTNCPFSSGQRPSSGDEISWKSSRVKIPARTRTVIFLGENRGGRSGVIGIDDVVFINSSDDNAPGNAC